MKKIERMSPYLSIGGKKRVTVHEADLDDLEQQRDELIKEYKKLLLECCIEEDKMQQELEDDFKQEIDFIKRISGKSWEEIKAGEK